MATAAKDDPKPVTFLPLLFPNQTDREQPAGSTVRNVNAAGQDAERQLPAVAASAPNGTTYYVDCHAGKDSNDGKAQSRAWKTMGKVNEAHLGPGDQLRFKRDCSWRGPLDARWNGTAAQPILISSFGTGELPKIQNAHSSNVRVTGSYQIIENLHVTLSSPPSPDPNCKNQPVGWRAGFSFQNGASHNIVQDSKATNLAIGIFFSGDTHHNKALHNTITDNDVVWELMPTHSLGAMGVLLQGDHQEVGYNYFADNATICTYTGTVESNSIELFAATNSNIHHNISYHDRVFSELGSSSAVHSANNTYAYNVFATSISNSDYGARFIVTRGANHQFGPVLGTTVYNNTVYLTGAGSKGVVCENCSRNVLTVENNILWVNREPVWSDGPFVETNNIYWSGRETMLMSFSATALSQGSLTKNPHFVDADNYNFNLQANSPAINQGTIISLNANYDVDLWRAGSPLDGIPDIGAYEYRANVWDQIFALPGRIEAEDYQKGGQGIGYSDTTLWNSGQAYRSDDVDIEATQDDSGAYDVGWIAPGEWLSYQVNVLTTGTYRLTARVATPVRGATFHIEIDGTDVSGAVAVPWTDNWQKWEDASVLIPLTDGRHTLRLVADSEKFNLNYLAIDKAQ
jgi:hypothetical protein